MNNYIISDEKEKIDINLVHRFLTGSYWAEGRSIEEVRRSIKNSVCYGIYDGNRQIGFARVLSDFVSIAYLMDVFIIEEYRGRGLSKLLLRKILDDNRFKDVKKWMLATADAHQLYTRFGFRSLNSPERLMEKVLTK